MQGAIAALITPDEDESLIQRDEDRSGGAGQHHNFKRKKEVILHEIQASAANSRVKWLWKWQPRVYKIYESDPVQYCVASVICLNFLTQVVQRTVDIDAFVDQEPTALNEVWLALAKFYNLFFLVELLCNAFGSWFLHFVKDGWNQFDIVVVTLGTLDLLGIQYPEKLQLLRMLRAFRVFRLFGFVESLRKIIDVLVNAMPGVCHSFVVVLIFMCIYAVMAVDLFMNVWCDGSSSTIEVGTTSRNVCFGEDYYGDFPAAFYTMFQILTGESWSEAAVRPILAYYTGALERLAVQLFFMSFMLLNQMVLLNVVVAVLLEGMSKAMSDMDKTDAWIEGYVYSDQSGTRVEVSQQEADGALTFDYEGGVKGTIIRDTVYVPGWSPGTVQANGDVKFDDGRLWTCEERPPSEEQKEKERVVQDLKEQLRLLSARLDGIKDEQKVRLPSEAELCHQAAESAPPQEAAAEESRPPTRPT